MTSLTKNHARLVDLVRQARMHLFDEDLITENEYAELAGVTDATFRLRDYDVLRIDLDCAQKMLRKEILESGALMKEVDLLKAELQELKLEHNTCQVTYDHDMHQAEEEKAKLKAELERLKAKRFPILGAGYSIPWYVVAPYEPQAYANHGQTLQRLSERGGLAPEELWCVMNGKKWRDRNPDQAAVEAWCKTLING